MIAGDKVDEMEGLVVKVEVEVEMAEGLVDLDEVVDRSYSGTFHASH